MPVNGLFVLGLMVSNHAIDGSTAGRWGIRLTVNRKNKKKGKAGWLSPDVYVFRLV